MIDQQETEARALEQWDSVADMLGVKTNLNINLITHRQSKLFISSDNRRKHTARR